LHPTLSNCEELEQAITHTIVFELTKDRDGKRAEIKKELLNHSNGQ
jgi:hypothetical protein